MMTGTQVLKLKSGNAHRVMMNDLGRRRDEDSQVLREIQAAVASGWYINGPHNQSFCADFARRTGASYCVGVANGTDALQLAISSIHAKKGAPKEAEVITVANAGGYTSTACYAVGCIPVYCDVNYHDNLVCIDSALSAITERTICVVATHLFGGLVDVRALRQALDRSGYNHVAIVEDCAQAHGLDGPDGTAGSLGDISSFSFYPTKNLGALGDGGAVLTNDPELDEMLRELRQYGWSKKYEISRRGGINSRLDEIQAAVLRVRLKHLDSDNSRRRSILEAYSSSLPETLHLVRSKLGTVGHLAVIMANDRVALRSHLTAAGVETDIHYPILDIDQPGWLNQPGRVGPSNIDVTRRVVSRILSVPCFPGMTDSEVEQVCEALRTYQGS